MALVVAELIASFQAAGLAGLVPPPATTTREQMADLYIDAYDSYASKAQSCAGLTPTDVNLNEARTLLRAAFASNPPDFQTPADNWADALEAYWDGASFGTGAVTIPGVKGPLSAGLQALWQASYATPGVSATILAAMATLIDVFTKTVTVADPTIPCTALIT